LPPDRPARRPALPKQRCPHPVHHARPDRTAGIAETLDPAETAALFLVWDLSDRDGFCGDCDGFGATWIAPHGESAVCPSNDFSGSSLLSGKVPSDPRTATQSGSKLVEGQRPITVVLVDDQHLIRAALAQALSDGGIELVGEAVDGEGAIATAVDVRPDVVLMDLRLSGLSGV
jgi:Response regulator receiver domain